MSIFDETGREIAPEQTVIAPRPAGVWDSNARPDGTWAGPIACGWCGVLLMDGDRSLQTSHGICEPCRDAEFGRPA